MSVGWQMTSFGRSRPNSKSPNVGAPPQVSLRSQRKSSKGRTRLCILSSASSVTDCRYASMVATKCSTEWQGEPGLTNALALFKTLVKGPCQMNEHSIEIPSYCRAISPRKWELSMFASGFFMARITVLARVFAIDASSTSVYSSYTKKKFIKSHPTRAKSIKSFRPFTELKKSVRLPLSRVE